MTSIRECLSSSDEKIFSNGLLGLKCLSRAIKEDLNTHLKYLVSSLNKGFNKKNLKNETMETL